MKPEKPPTTFPGRLASETISANWVAVKRRSMSPEMNATSTTPAKPCDRLSAVMAAKNAHCSPGFAAISR